MSNYKHTEVTGDVTVILETDDSNFMREYIKNQDVVCIDDVINLSDLPVKSIYMKDSANEASRDSSIATCIENLKCDMATVFHQMNSLKYAIESLRSKEKCSGL